MIQVHEHSSCKCSVLTFGPLVAKESEAQSRTQQMTKRFSCPFGSPVHLVSLRSEKERGNDFGTHI